MPFIEIVSPDAPREQRERLSERLTASLADAFGIKPEIVTIYYFPVAAHAHAHAGVLEPTGEMRSFLKVHAFERDVALKRTAAKRMTDVFVETMQVDAKSVVIYFFDRRPADVAHGGILACD
jgi:phenylpyruvate tautomerase PptA (4-oxalocrotonate tautomerase family)